MRCLQDEAASWVGGHRDALGGKWDCEPRGEHGGWQGGQKVQTDWGGETEHTERGSRGRSRSLRRAVGGGTGYGRGVHGAHRRAPAFSPDRHLREGPQGSGAEKAGFQSLGSGGTSGGRLGWRLGWGGPRWKDGLPPALGLVPGLPRKRPPSATPTPSHWASWGPPATAPQTLRESRPGQPGHSLQGALINQISLPCGHSPATGSGPPSVGSLGARRPVPQGDPSTCSPPRCSWTRPSAPSLPPPQGWTQTTAGITQAPHAGSLSPPGLSSRHQSPRQQVLC